MNKPIVLTIKNLPKQSLNLIYAGQHYSKRKKTKDTYKLILKSQIKTVFPKDKIYSVSYRFGFKSRPLDTSNTVYMLKMIEDIIFEDDSYKIVPELNIKSFKAKEDFVEITINEIQTQLTFNK